MLSERYGLDVSSSAVYYLFDRDRKSNRTGKVTEALGRFRNSREGNGFDMNGLLLLSYPSAEALLLNCINDNERFESGKDIKQSINDKGIVIGNLSEDLLIQGMKTAIGITEEIAETKIIS